MLWCSQTIRPWYIISSTWGDQVSEPIAGNPPTSNLRRPLLSQLKGSPHTGETEHGSGPIRSPSQGNRGSTRSWCDVSGITLEEKKRISLPQMSQPLPSSWQTTQFSRPRCPDFPHWPSYFQRTGSYRTALAAEALLQVTSLEVGFDIPTPIAHSSGSGPWWDDGSVVCVW